MVRSLGRGFAYDDAALPDRLANELARGAVGFVPGRVHPSMASKRAPQLLPVDGDGPKDVAVLDGRLITGVADGRLLSVAIDGSGVDVLADTGGRPLGIETLADGRLVVCDARRGLLRVDPRDSSVESLLTAVDGEPMKLCHNAAVTAEGTIYFTDSSRRHSLDRYRAGLIKRTGTGRLLRRDPSGEVQVLLDHLKFANGVALADDESFVAVGETGAARIVRVWLTGPRCGERDVLAANLPGLPDNLSTGADGRIWVTLSTPRLRLLRRLAAAGASRFSGRSRVIALDRDGQMVAEVKCGRRYRMVTGVREHDGSLYLGSLTRRAIAVLPIPSY